MHALSERPIQVYLEAQQDQHLRRIAAERGVSLSALVRESVEAWLRQLPLHDDSALALIDLGASGLPDLGSDHDAHLAGTLSVEADGRA